MREGRVSLKYRTQYIRLFCPVCQGPMYKAHKTDDSPIITVYGERFDECPHCDKAFRTAAAIVKMAKELKAA